MIKFSVKIDDKGLDKFKAAHKQAQFLLDDAIRADSNLYAPMDHGDLIGSSKAASQIGEGLIAWEQPQVRRLYYNPQYNFSKDKNPQAGGKWVEVAKGKHLKDWTKIVKGVYKNA